MHTTRHGGDFGKYYAMLAVGGVIWGIQPALIKLLMTEITPSTLTVVRFCLVTLSLFAIARWRGERLGLPPRLVPIFVLMGLFGVCVNNIAQFTGLIYSSVGNATLISSTTPAITAVLATVFLRERPLPLQWIGIFLSLVGVVFLACHGSLEVLRGLSFNIGDVLFIVGQVSWAAYSLICARMMGQITPTVLTAWSCLFGTILTAGYGVVSGDLDIHPMSLQGIACLLYVAFLGGLYAQLSWNVCVKVVGPSVAAVFLNIMPLVGVVLGVVAFGEPFAWQECFGAAGILGGVYLITQARRIMHWRNHQLRLRARAAARKHRP